MRRLREWIPLLAGRTLDPTEKRTSHRMTWPPHADSTVVQLWESTDVNGKWTTVFYGIYRRK